MSFRVRLFLAFFGFGVASWLGWLVLGDLPQVPFNWVGMTTLLFSMALVGLVLGIWLNQWHQKKLQDSARPEIEKFISATARQIAHDIRSPLAALDMVMKSLQDLPQDKKIVIRGAIARIRDIANNLAAKNTSSPDLEGTQVVLLPSVVDALVTEKRLQFRSRMGVNIDLDFGPGAYGAFSKLNAPQLKQILSDLINDSIQNLNNDHGQIHLTLQCQLDENLILIQDNGQAAQNKGSLAHQNASSLDSALASWGGQVQSSFNPSEGNTTKLSLPKIVPPAWYVEQLCLKPNATVVILDDDSSVHGVWDERFEHLKATEPNLNIQIHHFSQPQELRLFVKKHPPADGYVFLCDFELLGFQDTGLSLIKELGLQKQAVLVTSRFEEPEVRKQAQLIHVKLVPKTLINLLPLKVSALSADWDLVLLDDDPLVRQLWAMAAQERQKHIKIYADTFEFLNDIRFEKINKTTPLYIDINLEDHLDGREVAKECHKLGYTHISIATGHSPDEAQSPGLEFLKSVVGKAFPAS